MAGYWLDQYVTFRCSQETRLKPKIELNLRFIKSKRKNDMRQIAQSLKFNIYVFFFYVLLQLLRLRNMFNHFAVSCSTSIRLCHLKGKSNIEGSGYQFDNSTCYQDQHEEQMTWLRMVFTTSYPHLCCSFLSRSRLCVLLLIIFCVWMFNGREIFTPVYAVKFYYYVITAAIKRKAASFHGIKLLKVYH